MHVINPATVTDDRESIYSKHSTPYFSVVDYNTIEVLNWPWWDYHNSVGLPDDVNIHKWLNENTEYGNTLAVGFTLGNLLKFKHECELTAFVLRWQK